MNDERKPFLKARFVGERFDGKQIPLSVLPELSVYTKLVQDLAKYLYKRDHENRQRAPRGFSSSFCPALTGIEEGSAVAVVTRNDRQLSLTPVGDDYFDRAQNLITETIDKIGRDESPPPDFPSEFFRRFNAFGKSLQKDESVILCRKAEQSGAEYSRRVRKELVLKSSSTYQQEIQVDAGAIIGAETARDDNTPGHFTVQIGEEFIKAFYVKKIESDVLAALKDHERVDVSFGGIATFDRNDRILKIEGVDEINCFESLRPFNARLSELQSLPEGWLDGSGFAVQPGAVDVAEILRNVLEKTDIPVPYLYPTPEGGFQAEWSVDDTQLEVTLYIGPDGSVLLVWTTPSEEHEENLATGEVTSEALAALIFKTNVAEDQQ